VRLKRCWRLRRFSCGKGAAKDDFPARAQLQQRLPHLQMQGTHTIRRAADQTTNQSTTEAKMARPVSRLRREH
jgi:hypothetical protein